MGRNERAEDEKGKAESGELHSEGDLYDQGERDEATGKEQVNDEKSADEELHEKDPDDDNYDDEPSLGKDWLEENDK